MDQGGNYWTLFTPGIWKVLHAVLQRGTSYSTQDEAQARLDGLVQAKRRRGYAEAMGRMCHEAR